MRRNFHQKFPETEFRSVGRSEQENAENGGEKAKKKTNKLNQTVDGLFFARAREREKKNKR